MNEHGDNPPSAKGMGRHSTGATTGTGAGEGCNSVCIASGFIIGAAQRICSTCPAGEKQEQEAGCQANWLTALALAVYMCLCVCVCPRFLLVFFPRPSSLIEPKVVASAFFTRVFFKRNCIFCRCRCCCFSCAVACQSGSEGVGVCVHSAVEHCPVRWLLPMEWAGRKEDSKGHPTQSNILTKVVWRFGHMFVW